MNRKGGIVNTFCSTILCALVLVGGMGMSTDATAASFDCTKAASLVEKAICSDPTLSEMDSELGRIYKGALASSLAPASLKAEQKTWLSQRNQCQDVGCLKSAYQTRLTALSGGTHSMPARGSIAGTYKSKNGEVLVIQTAADRIKFSLSAFYKMNTGEVSGEAMLDKNSAAYSGEDGDCMMLFTFFSRRLEVLQEGMCGMGLNVSGAGDYKLVNTAVPKF